MSVESDGIPKADISIHNQKERKTGDDQRASERAASGACVQVLCCLLRTTTHDSSILSVLVVFSSKAYRVSALQLSRGAAACRRAAAAIGFPCEAVGP